MNSPRSCLSLLVVLLLLLLVSSSHSAASTLEGIVVKVADGDTITVLDSDKVQHRVRIAGIDAPEKGQLIGNASRKRMSELVASVKGHWLDTPQRETAKKGRSRWPRPFSYCKNFDLLTDSNIAESYRLNY